jgi:uncharacterized protein YndB with AHSA1/START domain
MEANNKTMITVQNTVDAPLEKVWNYWTNPEHITKWNNASEDWHTPWAKNDVRTGGSFVARMEAKDGSAGFDFSGTYDEVRPQEYIEYTMDDGRKARVIFTARGKVTDVRETFEAETMNSVEMQRGGWQNILDSFKSYTEHN